jgi:hypothetical protein
MAEPKPADPKLPESPRPESPKLVAVGDQARPDPPAPAPDPPERRGASWILVGVLALLLVLALGGLFAQTQRAEAQAEQIAGLQGQVAGLESRLTTATAQLAHYDRTLGLVRGTVSDLFARIADLNALVQVDPQRTPPPADPTQR